MAAHARDRCDVSVDPASKALDQAWRNAVQQLDRTLEAATGDCDQISVLFDGTGADVTLRTTDGRSARRRIVRAAELDAVVSALLVSELAASPPTQAATEPEEPTRAPAPRAPAPSPPVSPAPPLDAPAADPGAAARGGYATPLVSVSGGVQLSRQRAGPIGQLVGGATVGRWDLGAVGRWELERDVAHDDGLGGRASLAGIGFGALVGRRESLGEVSAVYGTTLALYSVVSEHRTGSAAGFSQHTDDSLLNPRAGLYLGVVFPRRARFRLRAEIDGEAAIASTRPTGDLPAPPAWGIGFALGVETGFAP